MCTATAGYRAKQKAVILDIVLSRFQDFIRDVEIIVPVMNSNYNVIKFSIHDSVKLPLNPKTITFFNSGNFTKMREILKRKLKGKQES